MSRNFGDAVAMQQAEENSGDDHNWRSAQPLRQDVFYFAVVKDPKLEQPRNYARDPYIETYGNLHPALANDHHQANMDLICSDPFASHQPHEPYPGYYVQIARDRREINDKLTGLFSCMETIASFCLGTYGIFGSELKTRRKWLTPPRWLLAGSKVQAFGGLGLGLGASYLIDRMFFKHDTLGDGSAVNTIVGPALALMVPGSFLVRAGAVVAADLIAKAYDHMTQPHYIYNPRYENVWNSPTMRRHGPYAPDAMIITAPGATPLPRAMFTPEDVRNQRIN